MTQRVQGVVAAAVAGLIVAAVGGCAQLDWPRAPETAALPPATESPPFVPAPPKPKPPPAPPAASAPAAPAPAAEPEQPRLTLPQLVGLTEADVSRLLGTAHALREEPPATVWEYRAGPCALDLFFYMDMESKRFRALAYDVSTRDGATGDAALNACLTRIMDRSR